MSCVRAERAVLWRSTQPYFSRSTGTEPCSRHHRSMVDKGGPMNEQHVEAAAVIVSATISALLFYGLLMG